MMREILDTKRCTACVTVLQALVKDTMEDESGAPVVAIYWLPRRVHTRQDCERAVTLYREEWPTLFDVESRW